MDGLCNNRHEPTPGHVELKKAYEPVAFSTVDGAFVVENNHDFSGLESLRMTFKLEEFGQSVNTLAEGEVQLPTAAAGERVAVKLPKAAVFRASNSKMEVVLTASLRLAEATSWAKAGHEVTCQQHQISAAPCAQAPMPSISSIPTISKSAHTLTITTAKSTFQFSRASGLLRHWTAGLWPIVSASAEYRNALIPGFWRPPTDNDRAKALAHWKSFGVDKMTSQLRSMALIESPAGRVITLTTRTYIAPPSLGWGWHARTTYQIQPDGSAISVFICLEEPAGTVPEHIPRIGFDLALDKIFNHVKWHGRGPGESYPDKNSSQRLGIWEVNDMSQLLYPYDVPQESGNHTDTRWLELSTGGSGPVVKVHSTCPPCPFEAANGTGNGNETVDDASLDKKCLKQHLFHFTATSYSAEMVEKAAHPCDLVEGDRTLLRLDAAVNGVGTAAVGPGVREDHLVRPTEASFGFMLALA